MARSLRPILIGLFLLAATGGVASAQDASAPTILQWFESSYTNTENRAADAFMAGYGQVWLPPPGRAEQGGFSVGYDQYDRFDLGTYKSKTLYGTETGLRTVASTFDRAGMDLHIDLIWNHNGFADLGTTDGNGNSFLDAGGYPGFLLTHPDAIDGDFNGSFEGGDHDSRLAGLIDIDQTTNFRYVRNPVPGVVPLPGDHGGNLPAGTTSAFGRIANVPDENNRRFYPDLDLPGIFINGVEVHPFNSDDPLAGDPVGENALGYLMRNARWMVEEIGVDGFRLDAEKHFPQFVLGFLDQAVYRANPRTLLDGSTQHVFSYGEVFDGDAQFLQSFVSKTIDNNNPGNVGANRDVLDFNLFFAMRGNLTDNGFANDWNNVVNAGIDVLDDGNHNGSQGVLFAKSHDDGGIVLENVAYAYTLLQPGNAVVYFNAKEFGDNRDFPKAGRGDALGGTYGETITTLVDIRNTHGRGDYRNRYTDKEFHAFERSGSAVVLLSNRNDGGVSDFKRIDVDLPFGTHLIELTGNHAFDSLAPELVTVTDDGPGTQTYINARFLNNAGQNHGYLIYGLATPQSTSGVELTNVDSVLPGEVPVAQPSGPSLDQLNGTTRLTDIHVIKADSFNVKLATQAVNLLGSIRDVNADGDNALVRIDGGLNLNGNGGVDFVTPGTVSYGFEQFVTTHDPGYLNASGNGLYEQTIDTTQLSEGSHYITVRAFRHRDDGGPAVFSDFKKVIYVDRLLPDSEVAFSEAFSSFDGDLDFFFRSTDLTADTIHVFRNLSALETEQDILDRVANGEGTTSQVDRDLFKRGWLGTESGNNVFTLVTSEITGTTNIQRITGVFVDGRGAGLGDLNFNGTIDPFDIANQPDAFEAVLYSQNATFNPAGDVNADGLIDNRDLYLLDDALITSGVSQQTLDDYEAMLLRRGDINGFGDQTDAFDIDYLSDRIRLGDATTGQLWLLDFDVDGVITSADRDTLVREIFRTADGDFDLDGDVDVVDLTVLLSNWQQSLTAWQAGNLNYDTIIDDIDLGVLLGNFTGDISPETIALIQSITGTVPEPTTLLLLVVAGAPLLLRRSGR